MVSEALRSVSISYRELSNAFEFVSSSQPSEADAYICVNTGEIYFVSALAGINELPEDDGDTDNYIGVPHKNDLNIGRRLVFDFVDAELPSERDTVEKFFRRPGAYGKFKNMLESYGMLDKWYAFEESAVEEALREWCQESGIQLQET